MGIRELFKGRTRDEVVGTKILVASLDPRFAELAGADSRCYSQFYPATVERAFESFDQLFDSTDGGCDVLHLFCQVNPDGNIADAKGNVMAATRLIQKCSASGIKLLWLAGENKPEGYTKGFKIDGIPLNMVLTLNRKGACFDDFLRSLLRNMSTGESMPAAWVALSPQNPNDPRNQSTPACMFAAGRGGVKFL